jgi:putative ABC transport system permease protein
MLKNYLLIALKNLSTQKLHSAINVVGLAVGLACFILISLFVTHDLSYDRQWAETERIYRVSRSYAPRDGARARVPASANAPMTPALAEEVPEIERAARVFGGRSDQAGRAFGARSLLGRDELVFYEDRLRFADPALLEIFDFDWLQGTPAAALAEPNSIVLTESLMRKYFGGEDALGQSLLFNGQTPLNVTGVIRDLPDTTHLSIDALASLSTLTALMGPGLLENWNGNTDFHTYVLLQRGADVAAVESRLPAFLDRHIENGSAFSSLTLMNVADIHLRSNRDEEWKTPGDVATVYSFAAIALGILLIACINFMNLSTARAATRAREVAVRKSLGATKVQMIGQFLGESILLSSVAMILAIALVEIALPAFAALSLFELPFDYLDDPALLFGLLGLTVIVGLLAGSYPAFYLSAFEPARVLKGEFTRGSAGALFRNALVVFQFSIAIALLIGTAVVYQQTSFARNLDLGFDKDRIVVLPGIGALGVQWPAFKQELLADPGIVGVTASHYTPFSTDDNTIGMRERGGSAANSIQIVIVDYGFFETYAIDVLAGRSFAPEFANDVIGMPGAENPQGRGTVIINAAAARLFGWSPGEAADRSVDLGLNEDFSARIESTIVGVVNDTHFESVQAAVRPLLFVLSPPGGGGLSPGVASIRVAAANLPRTLTHIDETWNRFRPDQPIGRHFLDQDFEALYQAEQRQSRMLATFSMLAIFVACLGLLGLASFTTEQRTKEIGVRKVMGGTVLDIVRLFTGEFSKLVLFANIIAWPAAYLLMRQWLANFAYRIDLSLVVFLGGGLAAFAVVLLTVGTIAARAASANPIHSLRYE